jgi:hypothetical protein
MVMELWLSDQEIDGVMRTFISILHRLARWSLVEDMAQLEFPVICLEAACHSTAMNMDSHPQPGASAAFEVSISVSTASTYH